MTVSRLTKEKRVLQDQLTHMGSEVDAANDKVSQLTKVKNKMESLLDEMEHDLSREKHAKSEAEKMKRKAEGEYRLSKEALEQLDSERKEAEAAITRKTKEIAALTEKLEREQSLVAKTSVQVKECNVSGEFLFFIVKGSTIEKYRFCKKRHVVDCVYTPFDVLF